MERLPVGQVQRRDHAGYQVLVRLGRDMYTVVLVHLIHWIQSHNQGLIRAFPFLCAQRHGGNWL